MPTDTTPLDHRLALFETIDDEARAALHAIVEPSVTTRKGDRLREAGDPAGTFWIVDEGWFYTSASLADGARQVFSVYMPGDVLGLQDLGWDVAVCDVTAATDGKILELSKPAFRAVVAEHPSLLGFFSAHGVYDHTQLIDRLRAVGRMDAIRRTAHFYCQVFADQAEPDGTPPERGYVVPLDQSIIGDAVGLTNISVSRMTGELEKLGLIERRGRRFLVPDLPALQAFCEFVDRRRAVPLAWIARSV